MATPTTLLDLPLEVWTAVCHQLDLHDLVRFAETCKRLRHGDGLLETAELPTGSPVVTALRERAFPGRDRIPSSMRPVCSESWVAYLVRCAWQRRCREAPPFVAGMRHSLLVDAAGRILACGKGATVGHIAADGIYSDPTTGATISGVRVRGVAAGIAHSLALSWDGRVYAWGGNNMGQLGHGDTLARPVPALVEGLESVRGIAAGWTHSLAVTRAGDVFSWGSALQRGAEHSLGPIIVEGFGEGLRVRRVFAGLNVAFAIGEAGQFFSWGFGDRTPLGHGDTQDQPSPKRVEALRGIHMNSVSLGIVHALALAEDGLVYTWGDNERPALLGHPNVAEELLPKPIEALRGVRVRSVAAAMNRSYALADTGELWAWGCEGENLTPLGHGEGMNCPLPKPIESLRGIKVNAVAALTLHTLAHTDGGHVYAWGRSDAAMSGALGLGPAVKDARRNVPTPQPLPAMLAAHGL
jgi:alpha-tubulin suppressor-like RCC1 family protein